MIQIASVSKVFGSGSVGLSDVSIGIEKGEFVFLVGHTGSGKTTLLRLLIREMLPTKGSITIGGIDVVKLPKRKVPQFRKKIGIVFQDLKLLMDRTIFENVLLPMEVAGIKSLEAQRKTEDLLRQVGVLVHRDKFPVQLSGGEMQRVAIARALALDPLLLLADEPTGNLDSDTANEIVDLLSEINKKGTTVIMATHNLDIVKKLKKRVIALDSGKLMRDGKTDTKEAKEEKKEDK